MEAGRSGTEGLVVGNSRLIYFRGLFIIFRCLLLYVVAADMRVC